MLRTVYGIRGKKYQNVKKDTRTGVFFCDFMVFTARVKLMAGGKAVILKDKADLTPEFRMG